MQTKSSIPVWISPKTRFQYGACAIVASTATLSWKLTQKNRAAIGASACIWSHATYYECIPPRKTTFPSVIRTKRRQSNHARPQTTYATVRNTKRSYCIRLARRMVMTYSDNIARSMAAIKYRIRLMTALRSRSRVTAKTRKSIIVRRAQRLIYAFGSVRLRITRPHWSAWAVGRATVIKTLWHSSTKEAAFSAHNIDVLWVSSGERSSLKLSLQFQFGVHRHYQ